MPTTRRGVSRNDDDDCHIVIFWHNNEGEELGQRYPYSFEKEINRFEARKVDNDDNDDDDDDDDVNSNNNNNNNNNNDNMRPTLSIS